MGGGACYERQFKRLIACLFSNYLIIVTAEEVNNSCEVKVDERSGMLIIQQIPSERPTSSSSSPSTSSNSESTTTSTGNKRRYTAANQMQLYCEYLEMEKTRIEHQNDILCLKKQNLELKNEKLKLEIQNLKT